MWHPQPRRHIYKHPHFIFQKSSVSEKNPCECFNTGFEHCVIYPKDVCNCSASCAFVQEYLQGNKDDSAEILSMRTFSKLITPMPGYDDNVFEESREGEKVSYKLNSGCRYSSTFLLINYSRYIGRNRSKPKCSTSATFPNVLQFIMGTISNSAF